MRKLNPSGDVLERATAVLRARAAASVPPELVRERTVQMLQGEGERDVVEKRRWTMRKVYGSSLAGLAAAVVVIVWLVAEHGSQLAAAQVLENVRAVQSLKMKLTSTMEMGGQRVTATGTMYWDSKSQRMRQEFENGIMVNVFDMKEGKGLFLSPPGKRATRVDLAHLPKDQAPRDLLDILKKLPDNPTKVLGEAQIEGRILQGFQWESTEGGRTTETTIWADPATRMPTVVDMKIHNGMLPQEIRMSEFQWDWPVEAALFSMEAPAGYAVSDGALDFAKPAEKDVVLALRASAAFNGGKFPEGLKLEQLVKAVASTGVAGQQVEAIMREQSLNILLSARGWAYISDPANGSDWHWAATGVTLGEKGRVVLWYRPVGKETYTVFDADLVVHTEAKAPEVASVKIEVGAR